MPGLALELTSKARSYFQDTANALGLVMDYKSE